MQPPFPAGSFDREDESIDAAFYEDARLVYHIDEFAVAAVGEAYRRFLPAGGSVLDLMSSWVSHLPADLALGQVAGLGMNELELRRNRQLSDYVVQDLNADPTLPYPADSFDGVLICVSVQYLTRPVEVFAEIGRVLKPGAPLIVTFSNRCFPTKAVRIWRSLEDEGHGHLVAVYAKQAGGFELAEAHDFSSRRTFFGVPEDAELRRRVAEGEVYTDPLFVVVAKKLGGAT